MKTIMAKITEEELTDFLQVKIKKLEDKLLKAKADLQTLKNTHQVSAVKLKKKEVNIIKSSRAENNNETIDPSTSVESGNFQ
jgi:hypothetical protein